MRRKPWLGIIIILCLAAVSYLVWTFLIFNQTGSTARSNNTLVPAKNDTGSTETVAGKLPVNERVTAHPDQAITLFLLKKDKVYVYEGRNMNSGKIWDLSTFGNFLLKEKQTRGDSLMIVSKPSRFGTDDNTNTLLSQLSVNHIENYTLLDVTKDEEAFIEKKQQEESK